MPLYFGLANELHLLIIGIRGSRQTKRYKAQHETSLPKKIILC